MSVSEQESSQIDEDAREKIAVSLFESAKIHQTEKNAYLQKILQDKENTPKFLINVIGIFFDYNTEANEQTLSAMENCIQQWKTAYQQAFRKILEKSQHPQKEDMLSRFFPTPISDKKLARKKTKKRI